MPPSHDFTCTPRSERLLLGYFDWEAKRYWTDVEITLFEQRQKDEGRQHAASDLAWRRRPQDELRAIYGLKPRQKPPAGRLDIEEIRRTVDFRSTLERYGLKGRVRGSRWSGLCPLHDEKNPSFSADLDRKVWYCFAEGRGGDIFSLVMELEGCEFLSAVRLCQ